MTTQFQRVNEFYTYVDKSPEFKLPSYLTEDEQYVVLACISVLKRLFNKLSSMSPTRVLEEIDNLMDSYKLELTELSQRRVKKYLEELFIYELEEWYIPHETITLDVSVIVILLLSINNMFNQLRDEIKLKATYHDTFITKDNFNVTPNFERATKKLNDALTDALFKGVEKNHRQILDFVYGEDKLYRWLCVNDDKTCDWCLYQQSLPPRPLSQIPYDHNHGRCTVEPIDDEYSEDYLNLLL